MKVVPRKYVLSGPFNLNIAQIPTPLGFFFGFFPSPRRRSSGVVFPRYGEERNRGFFLQNGGYYFAINDYMDLEVTGDIYSKGSYGLRTSWRYSKRYQFQGNMNLRHSFSMFENSAGEVTSRASDYWIDWNHAPVSYGDSRFSISISGGTSTFNANNFTSVQRNTSTEFNSRVTYNQNFRGTPFNLNIGLRHRQNVQQKVISFTLPELSLNMQRIYPLERIIKKRNSSLKKLGISYTMQLQNQISNRIAGKPDPIALNFDNLPTLLRLARNGMQQRISMGLPLQLFRYFVLTPSANYTELWYLQSLNHRYNPDLQQIQRDTLQRFSRTGFFNVSTSLSTRIYGTFSFKNFSLQAIRHLMTPSISFSYQPDFSDPFYGSYQHVQTPQGTAVLSRYSGFIYGGAPQGSSGSLGFQLGNQFEMKVLSKADSTGHRESKKYNLLENLSLSGRYNLLADSFNLSNISLAARTSLLKSSIVISMGATLDPYYYTNESGNFWRRTRHYAWTRGQGLGTITQINTSINLVLKPDMFKKKRGNDSPPPDQNNNTTLTEDERALLGYAAQRPDLYIDFNIPWSLNVGYNLSLSRIGRSEVRPIQSLVFSGSLRITPKTNVTFNSGYDFRERNFSQTSLSLSRDLHCWTLSANWIPFGRFTSYDFTLQANASILQNLRVSRRRNFFDSFVNTSQ